MMEAPGKTHATRSVIELRKKILSGELVGGTRLLEVPLAEELEISRTPLRDALSRLAEEGLLERGRSGGFIVRRFTLADVIDAIELRGVLEGTAARLAAERGIEGPRLNRMLEIVAAVDDCFGSGHADIDFERYAEMNAAFHDELARLPQSDVIAREIERAARLPFASPSAFVPERADDMAFTRSLHVAHAEHKAIVQAIAGREGARAEALAREHARATRVNLESVLMAGDRKILERVPSLALVFRD
ncbi:GntR family transcriptional regulator [Rhizobium halophytocola]|uniref:GntR family transcriptional regulator of vanillate catabolism n=1 Tax=Rhizobium halophytocola TaxID=735519 RepID=A0ABS4DW29_9HYPH|nr:GntR family transcriptional regulator [Rhizobium halophytocola]MBP1849906.1 GntR family transcriptional regulator of vanillate catabolism [Rhizobium halophytocola]